MSRAGTHGVAVVFGECIDGLEQVAQSLGVVDKQPSGDIKGDRLPDDRERHWSKPRRRLTSSCGTQVVSPRASQARLCNGEGILEVLELVGGDDHCGRLVLVCDRDPFPVPGRVPH